MSFGSAASVSRGRRPEESDPCPCGARLFGDCCGPVLDGHPAGGAEQLMRSRFTAFALGDTQHLTDSWFPRTRPDRVDVDAAIRWERLDIVEVDEGEREASVLFHAQWCDVASGERGVMVERSRFVHRVGRWFYVDAV